MSVLLNGMDRLRSEGVLLNSILGIHAKIFHRFPMLVKVERNYQILYMNFIVLYSVRQHNHFIMKGNTRLHVSTIT